VATALAAAVPCPARGDDTAAQREAQARFEEGIARVKAENFEGARVSFAQAYAVLHKPTILWNLALAEEKSGHLRDAVLHFKQFEQTAPLEDRTTADKHISGLMGRLGHVEVAAPAGAQVIVDGAPAGVAPLNEAVDVMPGLHHVEVHMDQGAREADVQVAAGQLVQMGSLAQSTEPSRQPPTAAVSQATDEGSARPPGSAPAPTQQAPSADKPQGHRSSAGRAVTVVVVGTVAVIALGLGAGFALESQKDKSTVDEFLRVNHSEYCYQTISAKAAATCAQWNDTAQAQGREATWSNASYIVGGVLSAAAVATWLLWPNDRASPRTVALTPIGGPGHLGLGAAGRF
jgi:hypothetical protein